VRSTDKQAERGSSLEAQAEKIRAMALVQDSVLSDIIVESGESAKSLNRSPAAFFEDSIFSPPLPPRC
jgi:hypothetical protein